MNLSKTDWDYIVIGAGPVGMRFCQELLKRTPDADVLLVGEEPYHPYNRIRLTSLLAGEVVVNDLTIDLPSKEAHPNFEYLPSRISKIDRQSQEIFYREEAPLKYKHLVFTTGARAFIPSIDGIDKSGVFQLRELRDAEKLKSRAASAKHIVIMGGGLLGLETARAMHNQNTEVTVIQQGERLLNKQLDTESANRLQEKVEEIGIKVLTKVGVREIIGDTKVEAVVTRDKQKIVCDTVIVCTGISPNVELAKQANIAIRRGILVDDGLKTDDSNISAIGECCEHGDITYGLVSPGFEQAAVLADRLTGGSSSYLGSLEVSRLKVVGEAIISMGDEIEGPYSGKTREWIYKTDSIYRKLVVNRGRVLSAIGVGDWDEARRVQEVFQREKKLSIWQLLKFRQTGSLWGESTDDISTWDDEAIICQCNNISKIQIQTTITSKACASVSDIGNACQAGTVCGSCKPLLQNLLEITSDAPVVVEKEKSWLAIAFSSLLAMIAVALVTFLPALAVSDTVSDKTFLEQFWNDKWWKQATGFTLLGLTAIGLIMSLRKRLKFFKLASFTFWRMAHMVLGALCALMLVAHTGLSLGANLNQALMINFLLVIVLGGLTGMILSFAHTLSTKSSMQIRKALSWTHLLLAWPLPILLAVHIFTVYYY